MQTREFERVGGNRTIKIDVRILAATNHDLEAKVRAGSFREDLCYRLSEALERHHGNVSHAAEEMGMYRQQLQSKLADYGIDPAAYRDRGRG